MNTLLASWPAASTPAMKTPPAFVSIVAGSCVGIPVVGSTVAPSRSSSSVLGVKPVSR
jgi:hypothetical protein